MPRVSIVIPCWNAGKHLAGLLDSLRSQTFQDFETILVDDGSSDPETLDAVAALPPDITVVRQENMGLPAARNTGLRVARGEYVFPLDCDDRIEPAFLAKGVALLDARPDIDFMFTDMTLVGARSGTLERSFNRFDQLFLNQLPYALLMRRGAWQSVGGYDETMRAGYEDWDFNLRLIQTGSTGQRLAEPLFVYRVAEGGMLLAKSARRHGELWAVIRAKHRQAYRVDALVGLSRSEGRGKISPLIAGVLLGAATLLPNRIFGALYQTLLARRARANSAARQRADI